MAEKVGTLSLCRLARVDARRQAAGQSRAVTELSRSELLERIDKALAAGAEWHKTPARPGTDRGSEWRFEDRDGRPWKGNLTIEPVPEEAGQYTATLSILRAG